jgi:hypothetical protein
MVHSEIINIFLPPWVTERYLASYVLDCFQSLSEHLNSFIMVVVVAAEILRFEGVQSHCKIYTLGSRLTSCL